MELMDVKGVKLRGTIFNDPIFHIALFHHNVWHAGRWIECSWALAVHGNEERGRAVWVVGVRQFFGEIEAAHTRRSNAAEPRKSRSCQRLRVGCETRARGWDCFRRPSQYLPCA